MPLDQIDVDNIDIEKTDEGKSMSFFDHLEQLRWHLIRSISAIIIAAIVVFIAKDFVFGTIVLGPTREDFFTFTFLCENLGLLCETRMPELITRTLGEQFMIHIVSSLWIGLIIAFPYVIWEIWRFVRPGLYNKERKAASGVFLIASFLFFCGVSFGYFIIAPFAVNFLASYSVSETISNTVTLASYVNYLVMFCLPTGIIFELPILVYFLTEIGLINPAFMKTYRRHSIILFLVLASIITPPDVITQLLISIPLIILYEISILISARIEKKNLKKNA